MLKDVLKKSGFSDKEADVYQALLGLGSAVVSEIAEKADINRSTTYVVLGMLKKRGLIMFTERRGVKMYSLTSPDKFVKQLEDSAKQYSELASEAKKLIPKIQKATARNTMKSKVRIYEGVEGMKTVYTDALSSLGTIRTYAFNNPDASDEMANYYDQLRKKNVKVKVLLPETKEAGELMAGGKSTSSLPREFSPEISVYDNKVAFVSPQENFSLIIESPELADALKKGFDLSWEEARKKGKNPSFGGAVEGQLA